MSRLGVDRHLDTRDDVISTIGARLLLLASTLPPDQEAVFSK